MVTVTSTVAAASAGAVAVIEVAESAVITPDDGPKLTDVAPERFVPVMVTAVPPAIGPDDGLVATTVGAGGGAVAKV